MGFSIVILTALSIFVLAIFAIEWIFVWLPLHKFEETGRRRYNKESDTFEIEEIGLGGNVRRWRRVPDATFSFMERENLIAIAPHASFKKPL